MILPVDEFLRRFLLHLLPRGFVRIRKFGFLANRQHATLLPLCFQLLRGSKNMPAPAASPSMDQPRSLWKLSGLRRNHARSSNGSLPRNSCSALHFNPNGAQPEPQPASLASDPARGPCPLPYWIRVPHCSKP